MRRRFALRAEAEGRSLIIDAPYDLELTADRIRLEQALGNLVENALRYGAGTIAVAAGIADGVVEFHVRDGEAGFRSEFVPRAFQRFSRPEATRSAPGAGLGLAIVETIARAPRGEAIAANQPGGGADVMLRVPQSTELTALATSTR